MDLMARRRAIMGMPSGKDYTVTGNVVSVSNALAKNAKSLIVSFSPKQSGSGDPSPNNIRPITGYNDIGAVRYGKNLCPVAEDSRTGYFWGTRQDDIKSAINGLPAGTYTITLKYKILELPSGGVGYGVYATKSSGTLIGYSVTTDNSPTLGKVYTVTKTFTLAEADVGTVTNFYLYCDNATTHSGTTGRGSYSAYDFQIEAGNTATQYEPYISPVTANVHSDTTLFGGTVDLVSGECVVTHQLIDLTDNTWNYYAPSGKQTFNTTIVGLLEGGTGVCDRYKFENVTYISQQADKTFYFYKQNATQNRISIRDDAYSDATSFKASVAGMMVVYPLATPITYNLTPSQLALLKGNNTVYSNEGSISLTYVGK